MDDRKFKRFQRIKFESKVGGTELNLCMPTIYAKIVLIGPQNIFAVVSVYGYNFG